LRRQSRRTRRGGPGCESSRVIRTRRGGKATRPTGREESGLGIDQRAEYFIGAANQAGAECGVVLAELQLDQLLADLGQRLGAVNRRQAGGGDRRGSLIDSLLGALVGAQAGTKKLLEICMVDSEGGLPAFKQMVPSAARQMFQRGQSQVRSDLRGRRLRQARHAA